MDLASETDAMLQGLAQDASVDQAPVAQPADGSDTAEAMLGDEAQPGPSAPAAVQAQEQVDDGDQVTTAAETYVAVPDTVVDARRAGVATEIPAQSEPGTAGLVEPSVAQTDPVSDQRAEQPVVSMDTRVNGLAETNGPAGTHGTAEADQAEPERGRTRKRRGRWGPPANAPAESAAELTADGEPTGRKKRRSRWEEPAPAADDSQQLAIVDMSAGSGFPHEIVLAGGIKVRHAVHVTCAIVM